MEMEIENIIVLMSKITSTGYSVFKLPENSIEYENLSIRFFNIKKSIEILFQLRNCLLNRPADGIMLSINQTVIVSKYIDFVLSTSFIPYLMPNVWESFENKQKKDIMFIDDISSNTKYEKLKFNVNSFFELIKESTLNKIIMSKHTNVLLAGLCQLSMFPIAKPGSNIAVNNSIDELKYQQLIYEQKMFKNILNKLILTDKDPLVIREIIFMLGNKNCQRHLKIGLRKLFSELLIQPCGIQIFLRVACDLCREKSQNFNQYGLTEWANLIHCYYIKSKTKYIQYIVPQLWELLRSNKTMHQHEFRSIAVFCINLMYTENVNDFFEYYIKPVEDAIKKIKLQTDDDISISQCIEDFHTIFYLFRNEIWTLDPKLLTNVATIIYHMYTATASGVYYLKHKLEDLVFLILVNFCSSKDHLKLVIFSHYQINVIYGDTADNIKIKYVTNEHQLDLEYQVDLVIELMNKRSDLKLMKTMFITLLDIYSDTLSNEYSIMEKLYVVKSIHYLIQIQCVQKSIFTEPEIVLNLIKSILKKVSEVEIIDTEVLSITLMILECIMENVDNTISSNQFESLLEYLSKIAELLDDEVFKNMVLEIILKMKQFQNTCSKKQIGNLRTIDDVLFDSRDPLLPCRTHALIELKKMIDSKDQSILRKKSNILIVIQENLKNSDSYLYLSAIFALSSFCTFCPNEVLPIICEQYSSPKNYNDSSETRLKIGEVLMKTIKLLNETIPLYKNLLLNTFMAGVRDTDHLVRASSLSNLADVCRLLRYNIGTIISEIVNCADYVLKFDHEIEPRRAAVLLLQMVIQGADSELLEILADSIQEIYHKLKFHYQNDKDETIKLHSQVALERLNHIMKSLFLEEKNIRKIL